MSDVWEMDFYSRPLLDENQKKIWELLVCDPDRRFEYVQTCSGSQANARWLQTELATALPLWRQALELPETAMPEKIRFFRRQMNSIITRSCTDLGIPPQPSRRTFTLYQWLKERSEKVYPQQPGFQPLAMSPLAFEASPPQPLPDALMGQGWTFASLAASQFVAATEWSITFGEVFPLSRLGLSPETVVPGLIIFSSRAKPLAGWMSGLELACLTLETEPVPQLILETGVSDRWILARLRTPQLLEEGRNFEQTKRQAGQVHFLAVQTNPQSEEFAGFWVLQDADMP